MPFRFFMGHLVLSFLLGKGTLSEGGTNLLADIEEEGDLFDTSHILDDDTTLPPPFPELTYLSLAHNKVRNSNWLIFSEVV